jgi:spore coat polysaccharide biosynthesis predicted glycosyltransferase SpsG
MKHLLLVCHAAPTIGLGHLSRMLSLAHELRKDEELKVDFLIFGEFIEKAELEEYSVNYRGLEDDLITEIKATVESNRSDVVVFDLYPQAIPDNLGNLLGWLTDRGVGTVGVDSLIEYCDTVDLLWIPSFYFNKEAYNNCKATLRSGWDSFLLQKRLSNREWAHGKNVLILTGGCDIKNLNRTLPTHLDKLLVEDVSLHWVQGPFSSPPHLPKKQRLNWTTHSAPSSLDELIVQSNYVLTVFGVTFFEVLQYGVPSVVFSPYGEKDSEEMIALEKENVACVSANAETAIEDLERLMKNDQLAKNFSKIALEKMAVSGSQQLAKSVCLMANL